MWWAFLLYWARLPSTVLGLNFLSIGVETGPIATQFSPACVQTLSPSPREEAAKWAYPLFLPQKELFSSFCSEIDFSVVWQNFMLFSKTVCHVVKLSAMQ